MMTKPMKTLELQYPMIEFRNTLDHDANETREEKISHDFLSRHARRTKQKGDYS